MIKDTIDFLFITILFTSLFFGCRHTRFQNNLQKDLDDLQRQIFEIQQDQAYINTKLEQVSTSISPLYERLDEQAKQIEEGLRTQQALTKQMDIIKDEIISPKKQYMQKKDFSEKNISPEKSDNLQSSPRRLYDTALGLIQSDEIDSAIPFLVKFLERYPQTELADNAQYWLGECYYKKGNYNRAIQEFKKILVDYPKGNKISAALLKIGYAYYELKQLSNALESLQKIIRLYPNDSAYPLAQEKLDLILSERGLHE